MSQGRRAIKMLGLSLVAALSLMAVTAVVAQAAGEIKVGGTVLGAGVKATAEGSSATAGKLLVDNGLEIECTATSVKATVENSAAMGVSSTEATYTGCKVLKNALCVIYPTKADKEAKTNSGKIVATGLGLIILYLTNHYIRILGLGEKMTFTNVFYGGAGCTLPASVEISGSTAAKLDEKVATEEKVNQSLAPITKELENTLVEKGLMAQALSYGEVRANLADAPTITNAHLTGANEGKVWGLN